MIYITGDTHAALDMESGLYTQGQMMRKDFIQGLSKDDILIVLGDFGYTWTPSILEQYHCPAVTLTIDGNHDNFEYLNSCPRISMFGSEVGVIKENVYRLISGNIYDIQGLRVFVFGGALSIDKYRRIPYVSWWPEEIPSASDFNRGMKNLETAGYDMDLFLAHTCPSEVSDELFSYSNKIYDPVETMLSQYESLIQEHNPGKKYHFLFGHHHQFKWGSKYICLYHQVISVTRKGDDIELNPVL